MAIRPICGVNLCGVCHLLYAKSEVKIYINIIQLFYPVPFSTQTDINQFWHC